MATFDREVMITIHPQLSDDTLFSVDIDVRIEDGTVERVASYADQAGLSSVFATLSQWAEVFTATGGNIFWSFRGTQVPARLRFVFEDGS